MRRESLVVVVVVEVIVGAAVAALRAHPLKTLTDLDIALNTIIEMSIVDAIDMHAAVLPPHQKVIVVIGKTVGKSRFQQ